MRISTASSSRRGPTRSRRSRGSFTSPCPVTAPSSWWGDAAGRTIVTRDGAANLADAVAVAGSPRSRGRGTLVVMHGQIHTRTRRAKEAHDRRRRVRCAGAREAGHRQRGRVQLSGEPARGPRAGKPRARRRGAAAAGGRAADVSGRERRSRSTRRFEQGARGIVLAAGGAGALTPSQSEAVQRAARAGCLSSSRPAPAPGRITARMPAHLPIIAAGDLAPVKARCPADARPCTSAGRGRRRSWRCSTPRHPDGLGRRSAQRRGAGERTDGQVE